MAEEKKPRGGDDIQRGNVGTGDQGPGDVSPHGKVDEHTGEMAPSGSRGPEGQGKK